MTKTIEQNPYRCSDGQCVFAVPGAPTGQHTNGGCRCIPMPGLNTRFSMERYRRLWMQSRWLAERVALLSAKLADAGIEEPPAEPIPVQDPVG